MKTKNQRFPLPPVAFSFAGFTWPRRVAELPRGTMVKRLAAQKQPIQVSGYYHGPKPVDHNSDERGFYLESAGSPGLRWVWCDDVEGVRINHTGWFADESGDGDKVRGVVFRLPGSRGFLAGWSMGENMASGLDVYVYDNERDAANAADDVAKFVAEREQENELDDEQADELDDVEVYDELKKHMALAFFGSAYADQAEECGQPMSGEIMDQLPDDVDPAALHAARTLEFDLINANRDNRECFPDGSPTLTAIYRYAQSLPDDGADRELTAELFGHYLAMQGMGTGVGLESFGDAVHDKIKVPYCEFGSHSLEKDYFQPADSDDEQADE